MSVGPEWIRKPVISLGVLQACGLAKDPGALHGWFLVDVRRDGTQVWCSPEAICLLIPSDPSHEGRQARVVRFNRHTCSYCGMGAKYCVAVERVDQRAHSDSQWEIPPHNNKLAYFTHFGCRRKCGLAVCGYDADLNPMRNSRLMLEEPIFSRDLRWVVSRSASNQHYGTSVFLWRFAFDSCGWSLCQGQKLAVVNGRGFRSLVVDDHGSVWFRVAAEPHLLRCWLPSSQKIHSFEVPEEALSRAHLSSELLLPTGSASAKTFALRIEEDRVWCTINSAKVDDPEAEATDPVSSKLAEVESFASDLSSSYIRSVCLRKQWFALKLAFPSLRDDLFENDMLSTCQSRFRTSFSSDLNEFRVCVTEPDRLCIWSLPLDLPDSSLRNRCLSVLANPKPNVPSWVVLQTDLLERLGCDAIAKDCAYRTITPAECRILIDFAQRPF